MSQNQVGGKESGWTFLSNHSHVLICLAGDPSVRMRDVASRVGITERAVQRIVSDLEAIGVLRRIREGRQNRYEINRDHPMRHPLEAHCRIGQILGIVLEE
jgi:predicted transcriptional regulator